MIRMKIRHCILLSALFLLLAGCTGPAGNVPASPSPSQPPSEPPEHVAASPSPAEPEVPSVSPSDGGGAKVPPDSEYEFVTETYEEGERIIRYPQFTGMDDGETQSAVNKMLKESAERDMDYLKSAYGKVNYDLDYVVTFGRAGFLSVKFLGYSYTEGAAHPAAFFYTANIDVENLSFIRLKDLVKIDEEFAQLFRKGAYLSEYGEISSEWKEALDGYLNETDAAGWVKNLTDSDAPGSDNIYSIYSYFSGDTLVISVTAPHILGDYTEIAIDCKDLDRYKTEHPLWDAVG